ncbi:hypothetical protein BDP27DRAFT_1243810, partial [Rhodocollybia butyracea]
SFKDRLIKGFPNFDAAKDHYQECLMTGVLEILKEDEATDMFYIVRQGFEPGVYTKRHMLMEGLNYCGGDVRRFCGTLLEAHAAFNLLQSQGLIKRLR